MSDEGGWFRGAGLGIFVHWDHASQQGLEVSWPMVGGVFAITPGRDVTVEQYHSSALTFDPVAFDAPALARAAAEAGATYAVFTAKHHSGYAMWPSAASTWSVASSPCAGRDLVGEFADAMRAEGLRVGLYFSLSDWHHPDYPAFTEDMKPYAFGASPPLPEPERWERFHADMCAQLTELLTGYGRIDVLWFDGGWERPASHWRSGDLEAMIRSHQPGILVNDRLPGVGDYRTPEQHIPATPPDGPWETCMTMNESWGHVPEDRRHKSPRALVHALCEVVGRGGNLLLNVSPRGDGSIPPEQLERLAHMARWTGRHRDAVIGTEPGLAPWQHYGPSTRRGDRLHAILLMKPYETVTVRGLPVRRVERVVELGTGTELAFTRRTGILERLQDDPTGEITVTVPEDLVDPDATVLAIDVRPTG